MPTKDFQRDERGAIAIMTAFAILVLLAAVGASIDYGNSFRERTRAQNVLDAALLAAAVNYQVSGDTNQARTAAEHTIQANSLNHKALTARFSFGQDAVTGTITSRTKSFIMGIFGYPTIDWNVVGAASYALPGAIDYALAVDISTSMRNGGHMGVLRSALDDFAINVFEDTKPGTVSVSLVPFANAVAFPDEFTRWLGPQSGSGRRYQSGAQSNAFNGCFYQEDRATLASLDSSAIGSYAATPNIRASNGALLCPQRGTQISFYADTETTLKNAIGTLDSYQGTATAVGVSWAWRTLDPGWQGEFAQSSEYPRPYDRGNKKVLILFTDGLPYLKPWSDAKLTALDKEQARRAALEDFDAVCRAIRADGRIDAFVIAYGEGMSSLQASTLEACVSGDGRFYRATQSNLSAVFREIGRLSNAIALTR